MNYIAHEQHTSTLFKKLPWVTHLEEISPSQGDRVEFTSRGTRSWVQPEKCGQWRCHFLRRVFLECIWVLRLNHVCGSERQPSFLLPTCYFPPTTPLSPQPPIFPNGGVWCYLHKPLWLKWLVPVFFFLSHLMPLHSKNLIFFSLSSSPQDMVLDSEVAGVCPTNTLLSTEANVCSSLPLNKKAMAPEFKYVQL